jgi:hypothetical protein
MAPTAFGHSLRFVEYALLKLEHDPCVLMQLQPKLVQLAAP